MADYRDDIANAEEQRGQYTEEEWANHLRNLQGELNETLDWMGKQGRRPGGKPAGKGVRTQAVAANASAPLGKGNQVRERNPLTAPPLPGQPDTRLCNWCLKKGHVIKDCRARLAGKPQI